MSRQSDHLDILKQGKDAWNAWRDKHPKTIPTLNLSEILRA